MRTALGIVFFCIGGLAQVALMDVPPEAAGERAGADVSDEPQGGGAAQPPAAEPSADAPAAPPAELPGSPDEVQAAPAAPATGAQESPEASPARPFAWEGLLEPLREPALLPRSPFEAAFAPPVPPEEAQTREAGAAQAEGHRPALAEGLRSEIALLLDGPPLRGAEDLRALENAVLARAAHLGARFAHAKQLTGGFSRAGVEEALQTLLEDPEIDLIIAYGPLASNAALRRRGELEKPVVAPIVMAPYLQQAPLHDGVSGKTNLTYVGAPRDLERDLTALRDVAPFETIGFVLSQDIVEAIPTLLPAFAAAARAIDVEFTFVPLGATAAETLAQLGPEIDAVYVGPLAELDDAELELLLVGFVERRLPSFSYWGMGEVARGLMVGKQAEQSSGALHAHVAELVERILAGEPASELPVRFDAGERLMINMASARAVGVWPDWAALTGAELVNDVEQGGAARVWTLAQVMRWAALANRDVLASASQVAASEQGIYHARSELYPHVSVGASGIVLDDDGMAFRAERQLLGLLSITQVLYSEAKIADYDIEKALQEGREYGHDRLVLDVQLGAALAYLNVLRAKTIERARRDDLAISQASIEQVELRRRNGATSDADLFRWKNRIAISRRLVLDAQAAQKQSELALNRILHRPLEEPLVPLEVGVDDPGLLMVGARLEDYLQNPWHFATLASFNVVEGLANSPELRQIEASLTAADREIDASRRAYWLPELSLDGGVTERFGFSRNTSLDTDDNTSWNVALKARFDLYRGGSKAASLTRSRHQAMALRSMHDAAAERVEEGVRASMYELSASYPGIRLAMDAALAARENLELARDAYAGGQFSVVEMLDAQDAAVEAEELTANAVHEFLIDVMRVQRAAGRYDYFMSEEDRSAWFERFERFQSRAAAAR